MSDKIYKSRPGRIESEDMLLASLHRVTCFICKEVERKSTYQEASLWLTSHLDDCHEGWDTKTLESYRRLCRGNWINYLAKETCQSISQVKIDLETEPLANEIIKYLADNIINP